MIAEIVALFIASRILLYIFSLWAVGLLPLQKIALAANFSIGLPYLQWIWGNFDGVNYVEIARAGYHYPNYAFFPLYPALIWLIKHILPSLRSLQIGLLVSYFCLFVSLFLIYKIALVDFSKKVAWSAIIFLLLFPLSFYYSSVYADSLYLFFSMLSFYSARKSKWLWAGFFGFLASLTRLIGIVLLPVLVLEWYQQNKLKTQPIRQAQGRNLKLKTIISKFFRDKAFFLFLIPLGIIGYGLYLQINFGDFFLFQKAMANWGQSNFVIPLQVIYRYFKIFTTAQINIIYFIAVVEFVSTMLYFLLTWYVFKKMRASYGLLMFLTFLIPTFTGTFQSMPRYILHAFPAFIALSLLTAQRKKLFWTIIAIFIVLQFVFVALFTRGYFVA